MRRDYPVIDPATDEPAILTVILTDEGIVLDMYDEDRTPIETGWLLASDLVDMIR